MNQLLVIVSALFFLNGLPRSVDAKSLDCNAKDYTYTQMVINRDGAIGFDGTFITISTATGYWGPRQIPLAALTGRKKDDKLILKGLELPLGPKTVCTPANSSLAQDFICTVKAVGIKATGESVEEVKDGSPVRAELITLRVDLKVDVSLTARVSVGVTHKLVLQAKITEPTSGRSIEFSKNAECTMTNN